MLLHIMSFTRYVGLYQTPTAQPNPARLLFSRVGFFWFRDADFEADTFHCRPVDEGRRHFLAEGLRFATAAEDLVVSCAVGRRDGERAMGLRDEYVMDGEARVRWGFQWEEGYRGARSE